MIKKSLDNLPSSLAMAFQAVVLVTLITFGTSAYASILFGPAVTYQSVKSIDNTGSAGGNQNTNALGADAKLGLLIEGTIFYVGGLYSYESTAGDPNMKVVGSSYGPTVGIFNGAFALLGTYIINADRTYSVSSVDTKISKGTGFRVDMSYVAGLTGSVGVGPQVTYRSIKYAKTTSAAGIESLNTYEESTIYPSVVFWFRF